MTEDVGYDLVEVLRDFAFIVKESADKMAVVMTDDTLFSEAADTIEQLQRQVETQAQQLQDLLYIGDGLVSLVRPMTVGVRKTGKSTARRLLMDWEEIRRSV